MDPTTQAAATALRNALAGESSSPARFAPALTEVPENERDAWLDVLWDVDELPDDGPLPRGCVPYLPCPVATVLEAIEQAAVTRDDVFVDVGAGLGRVAALVHLLTGASCIGLEIQPALVQAARTRATGLGLERLRFLEGDATDLVPRMTVGTVFFLYCPFGGERLDRVLADLEKLARTREIRVCCVGMQTLEREWLEVVGGSADLVVYRSGLHALRLSAEPSE